MIYIPFSNRNSDPNWLREAADEEYEASCPCPYVVRLVTHVVAQEKGAGAEEKVAGSDDHLLAVDGPLDHVAKA
jgi:hypothetical protein